MTSLLYYSISSDLSKDEIIAIDKTGKTPKTEANAIALRDSVNLFDPDSNLIAVYQKEPDGSYLFLTTCKLVRSEVTHLQKSNGNFLTERMIKQQNAISTNVQNSTNTKNDL